MSTVAPQGPKPGVGAAYSLHCTCNIIHRPLCFTSVGCGLNINFNHLQFAHTHWEREENHPATYCHFFWYHFLSLQPDRINNCINSWNASLSPALSELYTSRATLLKHCPRLSSLLHQKGVCAVSLCTFFLHNTRKTYQPYFTSLNEGLEKFPWLAWSLVAVCRPTNQEPI